MNAPAKPYYVILTGSKNNAGDFLIKHRAKQLFSFLRPDRHLIDLDAWRPIDSHTLDIVNRSQATILTGGPALQQNMYPNVYSLVDDLARITCPITTMGIGWYSLTGRWEDTHHYPLSDQTLKLLHRIESDGLVSSVRDYHTLNTLACHGFKNFIMTGCPALYSLEHLDTPTEPLSQVRKIGVSLGVTLKSSKRMFRQMQNVVLMLKDKFKNESVEVVFHHSLSPDYLCTHGASKDLYNAQQRFAEWLAANDIRYIDVSGSAEKLMEYYASCDIHIGYRVHAHIYMNSISKPSVLLSEDGRGIALKEVLSGCNLIAYSNIRNGKTFKALRKLFIPLDRYTPTPNLPGDLEQILDAELLGGTRLVQPSQLIKLHYSVMERYFADLP